MALTRSKPASIFTPEGNSLAVFIDVSDGTLKLKDVFGGVELFSDIAGGAGLKLKDDALMTTTLTEVADKDNTSSALLLATNKVKAESAEQCPLEVESTGTGGGIALLDNTTTNNTSVGIGALGDNLCFRSGGVPEGNMQLLDTGRLTIKNDTSATTQDTIVIAASETNAGIAIVPNGTGAITAQVPDGTVTGGNARGIGAVDLKPSGRTAATQVASGNYSAVIGGGVSTASGTLSLAGGSAFATGPHSVALGGSGFASGSGSVAIGGEQGGGLGATASGRASIAFGLGNTATADFSNSLGGLANNATSAFSTVSGGQSNTASTGTHATVVGGQGNTSSGQYSISGGFNNTASGSSSVALGYDNTVSAERAFAGGFQSRATMSNSMAYGFRCRADSSHSQAFGADTDTTASFATAFGYAGKGYLSNSLSLASYISVNTPGYAQGGFLVRTTTDTLTTGATTIVASDLIPDGNNRAWAAKVTATAFVSAVSGTTLVLGDSYMGEYTILFKRVGFVSSVVGVTGGAVISDTNMSTAAFNFSAGASQELSITFVAPTTASADTFRCVAKVELVEVAY